MGLTEYFVGGLSMSITEKDLRKYFSTYGPVGYVDMIHPDDPKSPCAYVGIFAAVPTLSGHQISADCCVSISLSVDLETQWCHLSGLDPEAGIVDVSTALSPFGKVLACILFPDGPNGKPSATVKFEATDSVDVLVAHPRPIVVQFNVVKARKIPWKCEPTPTITPSEVTTVDSVVRQSSTTDSYHSSGYGSTSGGGGGGGGAFFGFHLPSFTATEGFSSCRSASRSNNDTTATVAKMENRLLAERPTPQQHHQSYSPFAITAASTFCAAPTPCSPHQPAFLSLSQTPTPTQPAITPTPSSSFWTASANNTTTPSLAASQLLTPITTYDSFLGGLTLAPAPPPPLPQPLLPLPPTKEEEVVPSVVHPVAAEAPTTGQQQLTSSQLEKAVVSVVEEQLCPTSYGTNSSTVTAGEQQQPTGPIKAKQKRNKSDDGNGTTYFVGGLEPHTKKTDLDTHFSDYGEVTARVIVDKKDGLNRGFGFITFKEPEVAIGKGLLVKEHVLEGKLLDVKAALAEKELSTVQRTKRVHVFGLAKHALQEEYLRDYFSSFGCVTSVEILHDKLTKKPRGQALVTFEHEDYAENAYRLKHHELRGHKLDVRKAKARPGEKKLGIQLGEGRRHKQGDSSQSNSEGEGSIASTTPSLDNPTAGAGFLSGHDDEEEYNNNSKEQEAAELSVELLRQLAIALPTTSSTVGQQPLFQKSGSTYSSVQQQQVVLQKKQQLLGRRDADLYGQLTPFLPTAAGTPLLPTPVAFLDSF